MSRNIGRNKITAIGIIIAIALIIAGVFTGEPVDVMNKAVNICLECIGVG